MSDVPIGVLEKRVRSPKVRDLVEQLCRSRPSVKGDYRLLTYWMWKNYYGIKISLDTFDMIRCAPSPETIGRRYREIVEEKDAEVGELKNPFRPTAETQSKRRKNYRVYSEYFKQMGRSQTDLNGYVDGALV